MSEETANTNRRALEPPGRDDSERSYRGLIRQIGLGVIIILLPIFGYWIYKAWTRYPKKTTFAVVEGGRYKTSTEQMQSGLEKRLKKFKVKAATVDSRGSLDSLRKLQYGEVDFALYQSGTEETLRLKEFYSLNHADGISDEDRDHLSPAELLHQRRDSTNAEQKKLSSAAFKKLDSNGDKKVSLEEFSNVDSVAFVGNVYLELMHVVVRRDSDIKNVEQLEGKRIMTGAWTGHLALALPLFEHLEFVERHAKMGWAITDRRITLRSKDASEPSENSDIAEGFGSYLEDFDGDPYAVLEWMFDEKKIDAAVVSIGTGPSKFRDMLRTGKFRLLDVDWDALLENNLLLHKGVIPRGTYYVDTRDPTRTVPDHEIDTIGVRAQLLTRKNMDKRIVAAISRLLMNEQFQRESNLAELFHVPAANRLNYVINQPEFPLHAGARDVYAPKEFDAGEFEGWEAIYSLLASAIIASYLGIRWFKQWRVIKQSHKLDRYINWLFMLESSLPELEDPDGEEVNVAELSRRLKLVSRIRTRALADFSAHELRDDTSAHFLLEVCHYLSNRITAALSRAQA